MTIEKIPKTTLREQVYNQLRSKILGADLLPGEIINLRGLAEQFGVSLLPVREAVWQLESEGILIVESNKRIQVNHLTVEEFDEILNIRLLLESEAATQACRKRSAEAVEKTQLILEEMKIQAGVDNRMYTVKNDEFHASIYACSQSPMLLKIIKRLLARVNPYLYLYAIQNRDLSGAVQCHEQMFEAFAKGDAKAIVTALKRDLEEAAKGIRKGLAQGSLKR